MVSIRNGGVWRMWPAQSGGVGTISLHPTDAHFILQRGYIVMNGIKATAEKVKDGDEGDGNVHIRVVFPEPFPVPHP
jgi:hypothetical protein